MVLIDTFYDADTLSRFHSLSPCSHSFLSSSSPSLPLLPLPLPPLPSLPHLSLHQYLLSPPGEPHVAPACHVWQEAAGEESRILPADQGQEEMLICSGPTRARLVSCSEWLTGPRMELQVAGTSPCLLPPPVVAAVDSAI